MLLQLKLNIINIELLNASTPSVTAVKDENNQYRAISASAAPVAIGTAVKAKNNQYRSINASAAPVATVIAGKAEND